MAQYMQTIEVHAAQQQGVEVLESAHTFPFPFLHAVLLVFTPLMLPVLYAYELRA
jgi:hypothetical protein